MCALRAAGFTRTTQKIVWTSANALILQTVIIAEANLNTLETKQKHLIGNVLALSEISKKVGLLVVLCFLSKAV